jgi:hypothetical protein
VFFEKLNIDIAAGLQPVLMGFRGQVSSWAKPSPSKILGLGYSQERNMKMNDTG